MDRHGYNDGRPGRESLPGNRRSEHNIPDIERANDQEREIHHLDLKIKKIKDERNQYMRQLLYDLNRKILEVANTRESYIQNITDMYAQSIKQVKDMKDQNIQQATDRRDQDIRMQESMYEHSKEAFLNRLYATQLDHGEITPQASQYALDQLYDGHIAGIDEIKENSNTKEKRIDLAYQSDIDEMRNEHQSTVDNTVESYDYIINIVSNRYEIEKKWDEYQSIIDNLTDQRNHLQNTYEALRTQTQTQTPPHNNDILRMKEAEKP